MDNGTVHPHANGFADSRAKTASSDKMSSAHPYAGDAPGSSSGWSVNGVSKGVVGAGVTGGPFIRPNARSSSLPSSDDGIPSAVPPHHPFASPTFGSGGGSESGFGPILAPRLASLPSDELNSIHPSSDNRPNTSLSTAASISVSPSASASIADTTQKSQRIPSRQLLQTALDLAQKAVEMDKRNDVAGALAAYREAVDKLRTVMARVGVESKEKGKAPGAGKGKVEEEGRTLRGIVSLSYAGWDGEKVVRPGYQKVAKQHEMHDAYLARIQLLAAYETGEYQSSFQEGDAAKAGNAASFTSTTTTASHKKSTSADDESEATMGIGNLMLSSSRSERGSMFDSTMSPPRPKISKSMATPPLTSPPRQPQQTGVLSTPGGQEPSLVTAMNIPVTDAERASIADPFRSPPPTAINTEPIPQRSPSRTRRTEELDRVQTPTSQSQPQPQSQPQLPPPSQPPPPLPIQTQPQPLPGTSTPVSASATPMATPPMSPDSSSRHSRDMSSPRNRRKIKQPQRSLGLDMEADLTGIDGVHDESVEVLRRSSNSRNGGNGFFGGVRSVHASPEEAEPTRHRFRTDQSHTSQTDDRPLPPLPPSMSGSVLSSPVVDVPSASVVISGVRHASSSRKSSLSGIPTLDQPLSATGSIPSSAASHLVSPSTAQGTISQRRHHRVGGGASMTSISEVTQDPVTYQRQIQSGGGTAAASSAMIPGVGGEESVIDGLPNTRNLTASPFPSSITNGKSTMPMAPPPTSIQAKRTTSNSKFSPPSISQNSSSSSSTLGRLRARSQPGHRPSQIFRQSISSMGIPGLSSPQPDTSIPPVPTLNKAAAVAAAASLRVDTADYPGSAALDSGNMLAPPAKIAPLIANSLSHSQRSIRSAYTLSPRLPEEQPGEVVHRPFHLLRLLYDSMDPDGHGTYVTPSLLIDSAVWKPSTWASASGGTSVQQQANGGGGMSNGASLGHARGGTSSVSSSALAFSSTNPSLSSGPGGANSAITSSAPKIVAQEVKAKCLETLVLHLEALRQVGAPLLEGPREEKYGAEGEIQISKSGMQSLLVVVDEFVAALDAMDDEMDHTHKALSGKGVVVGAWKGKTGGGSKSWGSRFSRSVDKMTTGKNVDSPERYVDILSHLCYNAQIINEHLACFTGPCTPAYHALPDKSYHQIEDRMMRAAQFFGSVITPFILDDTKQFVLRYLKGGIKYLED